MDQDKKCRHHEKCSCEVERRFFTNSNSFKKLDNIIVECKEELRSSIYFKKLIGQMESLQILSKLMVNYAYSYSRDIGQQDKIDIVLYGLGSISTNKKSQFQLILALLLKEKFNCIAKIFVFDPVLSELDYDIMTTFGCTQIEQNEQGKRRVNKPTIFFMPHCIHYLVENILQENSKPWSLGWITILGNSINNWYCDGLRKSILERSHCIHIISIQKHCVEHVVKWPLCSLTWHLFPDKRPMEFNLVR